MYSFSITKIRRKVLIGFGLIAFIAGAVGAITDIHLRMLDDRDALLYGRTAQTLQYLGTASTAFQDILLLNPNGKPDGRTIRVQSAGDNELERQHETMQKNLTLYASTLSDSSARAGVTALSSACRKFFEDRNRYDRMVGDGKLFEAKRFRRAVLETDNQTVSRGFHTLLNAAVVESRGIRNENTDILDAMRSLMLIIVGMAAASALGFGLYLSHAVKRSLLQTGAPERNAPAVESPAPAAPMTMTAALPNAPAVQHQPAKKMRVFFDDTIEYSPVESTQYR